MPLKEPGMEARDSQLILRDGSICLEIHFRES